jgi:hypothetical protein
MKKYLRALLAYTLSTVSGLCLIGGVAVLVAGR